MSTIQVFDKDYCGIVALSTGSVPAVSGEWMLWTPSLTNASGSYTTNATPANNGFGLYQNVMGTWTLVSKTAEPDEAFIFRRKGYETIYRVVVEGNSLSSTWTIIKPGCILSEGVICNLTNPNIEPVPSSLIAPTYITTVHCVELNMGEVTVTIQNPFDEAFSDGDIIAQTGSDITLFTAPTGSPYNTVTVNYSGLSAPQSAIFEIPGIPDYARYVYTVIIKYCSETEKLFSAKRTGNGKTANNQILGGFWETDSPLYNLNSSFLSGVFNVPNDTGTYEIIINIEYSLCSADGLSEYSNNTNLKPDGEPELTGPTFCLVQYTTDPTAGTVIVEKKIPTFCMNTSTVCGKYLLTCGHVPFDVNLCYSSAPGPDLKIAVLFKSGDLPLMVNSVNTVFAATRI